MASTFDTVDEYIAAQPEEVRDALKVVRSAIQMALPDAEETISYNMPTYKIGGVVALHFAGWKRHFSLYPLKADLVAAFREDLKEHELEKGTLRILFSKPVPTDLIGRIVNFRATEIMR